MPTFRFKIDDDLALDAPVEVKLPDARQAETEALELLVELIRARPEQLLSSGAMSICVCDAGDRVMLKIALSARRWP